MVESRQYWPVPAQPPKAPQLTLLGSSVAPPSNDDINNEPTVRAAQIELENATTPEAKESAQLSLDAALASSFDTLSRQLGILPNDLRDELEIDNGEKWIRGFAYFPENHSAAINRAPGDVTTVDDPLVPANLSQVLVQPWDVGTKFTQSALTFQASDYLDRAKRQNDLAVPSAIEYEFWTGALAQANSWPNNYLMNITSFGASGNLTPGATDVHDGTPVSVVRGLGILQSYAARAGFGGQAMIHMTPEAVPNLLNVRRVGKFLLDIFDNILVPGVGYPTTVGPAHSTPAAGTAWMVVTDMVATRIQKDTHVYPSSLAEALDRSQNGLPNSITFRAERFACAYWDGFVHACVLVNLPT